MIEFTLKPTEKVRNFTDQEYNDILNLAFNYLEIHSIYEEFPLPWDAGIEIKGKNIIIEGGAGPSGYGNVTVEVPINAVDRDFKLIITAKKENEEKLRNIIKNAGWEVLEKEV